MARKSPALRALAKAPLDDEPISAADKRAVTRANRDVERGDLCTTEEMQRLVALPARGGKRPGAGRRATGNQPATSLRLTPELAARVKALRTGRGYSLPEIVRAGVEALEERCNS